MKTASISAISVVPRMKPAIAPNASRPQAMTVSARWPGRKERTLSLVRSPSRRKKKTRASASTPPVISWVATPRPESTPPASELSSELPSPEAFCNELWIFSPAGPSQSASWLPASLSEETISGALWARELTSSASTAPTATTRPTQVSPAAAPRPRPRRSSHGISGWSSAVPSSARIIGMVAARSATRAKTASPATVMKRMTATDHAAAARTAGGSTCSGLRRSTGFPSAAEGTGSVDIPTSAATCRPFSPISTHVR